MKIDGNIIAALLQNIANYFWPKQGLRQYTLHLIPTRAVADHQGRFWGAIPRKQTY